MKMDRATVADSCARGPRAAAFTLIELLVVIAIIAVLIALLFPAIEGARKQANLLKCMTNQRFLANSLVMYSDDLRSLPPIYDAPGPVNPWYGSKFLGKYLEWDLTRNPLEQRNSPLRCPSPSVFSPSAPRGSWIGYNCDFGVSDRTANVDNDLSTEWLPGKPIGKFRPLPATVVTFVDARSSGFWYIAKWAYHDGHGPDVFSLDYVPPNYRTYDPRHDGDENGGANFAFADGSVRYIRQVNDAFLAKQITVTP